MTNGDPVSTARMALERYTEELDVLSKEQMALLVEVESVDREYDQTVGKIETDLWDHHVRSGQKLPSEKLRSQIAATVIPYALSDSHAMLHARLERNRHRISALKTLVEAQRSILSALKVEVEATL